MPEQTSARAGQNREPKRTARVIRRSSRYKVRKAFWLDPRLLDNARKSLGASSERETVEMALDLAGFQRELRQGAHALRRLPLSRID